MGFSTGTCGGGGGLQGDEVSEGNGGGQVPKAGNGMPGLHDQNRRLGMCQWASILHVLEISSATCHEHPSPASPAGTLGLLGLVLSLLCDFE